MTRTGKIIVVAAVAGLAVYAYKEVTHLVKNWSYKIQSITFDKNKSSDTGFSKLYWLLRLQLVNPANVLLTVKSIAVDIFYNDVVIGKIFSTEDFTVNPKTSTLVNIKLSNDVTNATQVVLPVITSFINTGALSLKVVGDVVTDAGTIHINEKYKVV